jgi:hypothetical protein
MNRRTERHYARLLRLYPKTYRDQRGAEMLATLLDAAEAGRARPAYREIAALIVGALRIRTGATVTSPPGRAWLSALRVAVLLVVADTTAQVASYVSPIRISVLLTGGPTRVRTPLLMGSTLQRELGLPIAVAAGVLALLAIAGSRYGPGMVLIGAAFGFEQWAMSGGPDKFELMNDVFWQLPVAVLLVVPLLLRRPAAAGRPLAGLLAVAVAGLLTLLDLTVGHDLVLLAAAGVGLLWSLVDARAAIAAAALLLGPSLAALCSELPVWSGRWLGAGIWIELSIYLSLFVVLLGMGALLVRRRARA